MEETEQPSAFLEFGTAEEREATKDRLRALRAEAIEMGDRTREGHFLIGHPNGMDRLAEACSMLIRLL